MYNFIKNLLTKYIPGINKEGLLLVAGFVWLFAGAMLFIRGSLYIYINGHHKYSEVITALIIGAFFYILLFIKISIKHITRIRNKKNVRNSPFSFFDAKGYVLMCVMITTGITIRHFQIVNPEYLNTFYMGMGIPLIRSSFDFFHAWHKETVLK